MIKGIAASNGYVIGKAFIIKKSEIIISNKKIEGEDAVTNEKNRLKKAIHVSKLQIEEIKEKALLEMSYETATVFDSHILLLHDPEFISGIENEIENNMNCSEAALKNVMDRYLEIFQAMEDEYMKERAADIKDVGNRILANLVGTFDNYLDIEDENTVVVANDLTPSDTARLNKQKVSAFITNLGGKTSHSAIMARTLLIPAVVGLGDITEIVKNGDVVIVDGTDGNVVINPSKEIIDLYIQKKYEYEEEKSMLKKYKYINIVNKDGKRIEISGNIGRPEDVKNVLENGGDGIGLFRTEFLYMDRDNMPSEEEQFESYKYVAKKMDGKPVIIRTLDIGGDKKLSYLEMPEEMNPFLGYRAIRICLDRVDIFKTQLRAILRAATFGNVKIMFPMISSVKEYLRAREILNECALELKNENVPCNDNIEVGIMVEIPAAAICADELAKHVDFFSIGTNDLIQYTLAADRMNEKVAYLYEPMHPAVLKLIKMTIDAAHSENIWCGMCGEMAGDEHAITTLLEYGLDEFSMSASSILNVKKIIMKI